MTFFACVNATGAVSQVLVAAGETCTLSPPPGTSIVTAPDDGSVLPGWSYNGTTFSAPDTSTSTTASSA